MDTPEKLALLSAFETAVDPLIAFVQSAPTGALDFKPAIPGAWSIRDHAAHFLDADTFAYGRLRLAITQPGVEVFVWNEEAWQERGKYDAIDPLSALESARSLRRIVAATLRPLVDTDWESHYIRHPQRGRLTLKDVLKIYADHAGFHLSYFRRNQDAFMSASK